MTQALDINSGNYSDVHIRSDRVFDQETLILELGPHSLHLYLVLDQLLRIVICSLLFLFYR